MRVSASLPLAMQAGSHFASFRQGMTIVTSILAGAPVPIAITLGIIDSSRICGVLDMTKKQ
jgi:hypothetical protein